MAATSTYRCGAGGVRIARDTIQYTVRNERLLKSERLNLQAIGVELQLLYLKICRRNKVDHLSPSQRRRLDEEAAKQCSRAQRKAARLATCGITDTASLDQFDETKAISPMAHYVRRKKKSAAAPLNHKKELGL